MSGPHTQFDHTSIIDGIPAHVALIDSGGIIRAVNQHWRRFAAANGLCGDKFGVGSSYLSACETAATGSAEAGPAATGIRQVLAGEASDFSLEYPCHSTTEQRWFQMVVTPLGDNGGAIVMHFNITDRISARSELQNQQSLLRMASSISNLGAWQITLPDETVYLSDAIRRIMGVPSDEDLTLEQAIAFLLPHYRDLAWAAYRDCKEHGTPFDLNGEAQSRRGERRWVRILGQAQRANDGTIILLQGAFQDISAAKAMEESLFESEARFRQLAESIPMIVWTATPEGVVDYSNEHFSNYSGISLSQPAATRWQECLHPNDLQRCLDHWMQCVENQQPFDIEYRIRRASDNSYRWFRVQATLVKNESGAAVKWYGTALDVDDIKRLEEESRSLADRLSRTLNSMTDALLTFDRQWKLIYLNREAERMLRHDSETLIGRSLQQIFPDLATNGLQEQFQCAIENMETVSFHAFHKSLNIWFSIRAYPAEQGLTVYLRDITAEYEKDKRLREQAALLDKAKDAIILRGLDHTVLFWNKGAERIYGWKREEVLGKVIAKLLYADPTTFYAATEQTLANGEWTGEIEQITRKGETVTIDANWTLLHDDDGKPNAILAINTNVSERKKLENSYHRAQRLESIGTLASGIAHDLNNLLSPVVMGVELLRSAKNGDSLEPIIKSIEASAQRGTELVKQILSFAKGVDGPLIPLGIQSIFSEIEMIAHNTFPKNVVLSLDCQPDLRRVLGDATRLHQVFLNLCVNARDAMPDGGKITIHARNEVVESRKTIHGDDINPGAYVRIDVTDSGCGIPRSCIEKIFDPFFSTKPPGYGTGLGLATSLGIIRSHNGFITVSSKPGQGSCFSVFIPAHEEAKPLEQEKPSSAGSLHRGNGQTILVVDDEAPIVAVTRQILVANGYTVIDSCDGADAIALFAMHQGTIDLVLTDLMMPGIDGPALIAAVRKIVPDIKVVATSGLHTSRQVAKAGEIGIEHFLVKPYSAAKLLEVIDSTLNPPSPS